MLLGGFVAVLARTSVPWGLALGGTSVIGLQSRVLDSPSTTMTFEVVVWNGWLGFLGVGVTRCWVLRDRANNPFGGCRMLRWAAGGGWWLGVLVVTGPWWFPYRPRTRTGKSGLWWWVGGDGAGVFRFVC